MDAGQNKNSDGLDFDFREDGLFSRPAQGQASFGMNGQGKDEDSDTSNTPETKDEDDLELYKSEQPPLQENIPFVDAKPAAAEKIETDNAVIPKAKIILIKKLLSNIKSNHDELCRLIAPYVKDEDEARIGIGQLADDNFNVQEKVKIGAEKIIEGVFDGEKMIGPDGKQYSIPANYASKSKLVEGDMMKLTITPNGTFLYKQIGPVERARIIGNLEKDSAGGYSVVKDDKSFKVLTASITYYRGEPGDEVIILVPKFGQSAWAAVENIIKKA